jgi:hypothetical protein
MTVERAASLGTIEYMYGGFLLLKKPLKKSPCLQQIQGTLDKDHVT